KILIFHRFSDEKIDCNFKIAKVLPKCGHTQLVDCHKEPLLFTCRQPCSAELKCGHSCKGNCCDCRNGRLHVTCNEECGKILICGHKCETPCAADCPPCEKQCTMQCNHSKCSVGAKNKKHGVKAGSSRICGVPCPPCNEKCSWKCPHFECKQKCNERCDRPRCDEKCEKTLKCKKCKKMIPCISLCGEICIYLCQKCDESRLKEIREIFFGMEEEPDARFIKLRDCGHIFEITGFDSYVDNSLVEADEDPESDNIPVVSQIL
uniref:NFX1-type zinc finger-containing protein 1 n=1 Tax=Romanomermis culicivorax TaxID=13658 RepID=A0A915HQP0_ROMCU